MSKLWGAYIFDLNTYNGIVLAMLEFQGYVPATAIYSLENDSIRVLVGFVLQILTNIDPTPRKNFQPWPDFVFV
jgi:hypothetical protein